MDSGIKNSMLIIGSSAIKHHYNDFPREPKDLDVITDDEDILKYPNAVNEAGYKYEYLRNPILLDRYKFSSRLYLSKEDLITLKASHLCWNINWDKHMFDLQFLLKKENQINIKLFWELYDYWNEYHGKNKRSDLKLSKDEFFNNAVNYNVAEHDIIHTILNPIPIYTRVLKDGCEVELDENKFNSLSYEEKLDFVREEVMVMAFERFKNVDYRIAYNKMLKKFIINHCPKFALIFTLENYIQLEKPKFNYLKKIQEWKQLV